MNQLGIDVSNDSFDATRACHGAVTRRQFANTPAGHRQCIKWALRGAGAARVCLEATGVYHLQLALALHHQPAIELMVVNPRAAHRLAEAHMVRAKTDRIDADGLPLFVQGHGFNLPSLEFVRKHAQRRVERGYVNLYRSFRDP